MRTLFLAAEPPLPPNSGSRLRVLHLARQLARDADVEFAALGEAPFAAGEPFAFRGAKPDRGRLGALVTAWREPYMAAKHASAELARVVSAARPDTIHVEPTYLFSAVRGSAAPAVLGAQNVEAEVMQSFAATERRPLHRARWRWEARKTERFERAAARAAAAVTVPSDHDAEVFERFGARHVVVVPNGVDTSAVAYRPPAEGATLLYIGHYGYLPNAVAARELVEGILPRVAAKVPEARVRLIGRDAEKICSLERPGVEIAGQVEDAVAELHRARGLVVPLRAGGGTRLKILEALAAGVPVVSTSFGIAGLDLEAETLVGESAEELADLTVQVIEDAALARSLSEAGRRLVEERYDWSVTARPLVELHHELAER